MANLKNRRLKYSRANWIFGFKGKELQYYVEKAHAKLDTAVKRTFSYNNMEMQGLDYKVKDGVGIFVHVAVYTPGQDTSLVPVPSPKPHVSTDTTSPPTGKNFMDGDTFFLISDNHIIICPSDTHEAVATQYILKMMAAAGFTEVANSFTVEKILNYDKIRIIHKEGVKKICLGGSLYEASLDRIERKTLKSSLLSRIPEEFELWFGKNHNLKSIQEHENINVQLILTYDKRKKGGQIGRDRLEMIAKDVLDEDENDGIAIETFSGNRMTQDEIRISKKVSLSQRGKSVDCNDAWRKIWDYYRELKDLGMIEQ